jgi:tRNA dimethylallyltransferase
VTHLALVGVTASGKSALAMELARRHPDLELVSIDSMQVYREMDIGTAKPTPAERAEVPHHLIDLADPDEEFTVVRFQAAFADALAGIEARGHRALLVGGTGLYLQAVVDQLSIPGQWPEVRTALEAEADALGVERLHAQLAELDPVAAVRMEPSNRRRVLRALEVTIGSGQPFSSFGPGLEAYPPTTYALLGITLTIGTVRTRIAERYEVQLAAGFVDEVRRLAARPAGLSRTARQALGYRELLAHVEDGRPLEQAVEDAVNRTRQLARRQRAWFRRDPRIRWFEAGEDPLSVLPSLDAVVAGHT